MDLFNFYYFIRFLWAGYPISYKLIENEQSIVLKRSLKNSFLQTMLSATAAAICIFLSVILINFIRIFFLLPVWLLLVASGFLMIINIICIWTYKLVINKETRILTLRWHLIKNKYSLGGRFWVDMPGQKYDRRRTWHVISGAEVYYDKRFLFGLPYESEVYQRILEYLREEGIRMEFPLN